MFEYSCNKLHVAYNDAFRLLLKEPDGVVHFALHRVTSFDAMICELMYFFWTSLHSCDNAVVCSFLNSNMFNCSHIVRRWHANFLLIFNF